MKPGPASDFHLGGGHEGRGVAVDDDRARQPVPGGTAAIVRERDRRASYRVEHARSRDDHNAEVEAAEDKDGADSLPDGFAQRHAPERREAAVVDLHDVLVEDDLRR